MKKTDFEFLVNLLRQNAGWDFEEEQYFVVDKKISNFIREKGYASVEDLVSELKTGPKRLINQVVESLALSDTYFYRDYDVFLRFENAILPAIRESSRSTKKLRFWSLGCSTGQETYSIAMGICKKFLGLDDWNIDILGTDISSVAISKAQHGLYNTFEVQMGLNASSILTYFHKEGEQWQVNDELRRMVEFRRYNLLENITLTDKFEVIFCRNVLRFFTPEYQREIVSRLCQHQPQGGFLYLGKNETIECIGEYYDKLPGYNCVYVSKGISGTGQSRLEPAPEVEKGKETAMPHFVRPNILRQKPLASEALKKK